MIDALIEVLEGAFAWALVFGAVFALTWLSERRGGRSSTRPMPLRRSAVTRADLEARERSTLT